MGVNWRKGFNRLFLLAALGWAIYILWYIPVEQWHEQSHLALDSWTNCLSAVAPAGDKTGVEQCNLEHDKHLREIPHTAWTNFGWNGWLHLMEIAFIPPFVAYWLLRAVGFTFNWIWGGFTS
jgi:hypothetical protein